MFHCWLLQQNYKIITSPYAIKTEEWNLLKKFIILMFWKFAADI